MTHSKMSKLYYWNGTSWGGQIPPSWFYKQQEKPRNLQQNALYWVLISWVADETGNDKDFLHELMKKKFLAKKKLVKLWKSRNFATKILSTTKLSQKDFARYFERVEWVFATYWYVLPPHNSQEFQSLCETYKFL